MDRRQFLKLASATAAAVALPVKWLASRAPTAIRPITIAAANASPASKVAADYVVSDGYTFGQVMEDVARRLTDGGQVRLTSGTYQFDDAIDTDGRAWGD